MLLNPLIFNCWCSVCVPLPLPALVCTLSLQRFLLEDCSTAPAAATVLSLALAALLVLVPDCLRQLLLLRGRLCLVVQILLHLNICAVAMGSYVCQSSVLCYHVKRSFSGISTAGCQHDKITVDRRCTHRDMDNIGVWRGVGALCQQTLLHSRKSHSASLCITANAANRRPSCSSAVDKSSRLHQLVRRHHCFRRLHVAATAVSLPQPRALAPSAAVTVLPLSLSLSRC